jgi:hypothetical protein
MMAQTSASAARASGVRRMNFCRPACASDVLLTEALLSFSFLAFLKAASVLAVTRPQWSMTRKGLTERKNATALAFAALAARGCAAEAGPVRLSEPCGGGDPGARGSDRRLTPLLGA